MFPFTSSQWQELQRQALIYKHMAASVPIPLHLLLPSSASSFPQSPTMNLRFKNGMMDPEPGRCRRTDGKKWRCAKGAEPDQKYCEKHLNRKRPRSRKLVEQLRLQPPRKVSRCDPNIELKLPFRSVESNGEQPRCQDWAMGYSENLSSNRQWEMRHSCTGLKYNKKSATEQYEELPRLNYNDASGSWCDFRNPYPSPLDETAVHNNEKLPARSIDAWSTASTATTISPNESSVLTKDKLSPSTLTLTMSNTIEERTDLQLPMGFGGPLGEVLQSRSNVASPCDGSIELINLMCMGHETCPQDSPLVSSSSGILQKGFVLPSDNSNSSSSSSSSSSPSFDVASRSDFAFKWMNFN